MMYNKKEVFKRYLNGQCSPEEAASLLSFFSEETFHAELKVYIDEIMQEEVMEEDKLDDLFALSKDQYPVVESLLFPKQLPARVSLIRKLMPWSVAAAAVLLLCFAGYSVWNKVDKKTEVAAAAMVQSADIPSGVTLTLPSGEVVALSDSNQNRYATSRVAEGDNFIALRKLEEAKESMIQEVNVPQGKTSRLILTDGTKVWLNANSKLTYDVNFIGAVRHVKLEGEAYFEVAPNKDKPFVVASQDQQVRVLGTHFNVKAYGENRTTTTLMEGRVEVSTHSRAYTLKPGESSIVSWGGADIRVGPALMYKVNAWRNNEFGFYDASLEEIGRELSRWYGVEVKVVGRSSYFGFTGVISKDRSLEEVLEILNRTGQIRYHIVPTGVKERRVVLMA